MKKQGEISTSALLFTMIIGFAFLFVTISLVSLLITETFFNNAIGNVVIGLLTILWLYLGYKVAAKILQIKVNK